MKLEIEIPKEIADDYLLDNFRDFFVRVIADINCEGYCGYCGNCEKEIAEAMKTAFGKSKVISW